VPKKAKSSKRQPKGVTGLRSEASTRQARDQPSLGSYGPAGAGRVTRKTKPLYRKPPPKPKGRAALPRSQAEQQLGPTNKDLPHAHPVSSAHFALREDGSIVAQVSDLCSQPTNQKSKPHVAQVSDLCSQHTDHPSSQSYDETRRSVPQPKPTDRRSVPQLVFSSDTPFVRLYHGNSLELLDAIAAKYPDGRFDAIIADPPAWM
jgi:hypothetical protein